MGAKRFLERSVFMVRKYPMGACLAHIEAVSSSRAGGRMGQNYIVTESFRPHKRATEISFPSPWLSMPIPTVEKA